ncbi:hypothetical protein [Nocardioides conyzicola]|uniref:MCE family protein n=1 Tax=Nocardioides conyzicola TaxID=1651781 RepID=A0ABP8XYC8_9ACTN
MSLIEDQILTDRPRCRWRRIAAVVAATLILCAVLGVLVVRDLERNRVVEVGSAVVAIEGRDIHFWPPTRVVVHIGVGVMGQLGLVGGRCVGFVNDVDPSSGKAAGVVIVWPPGTSVSGEGDELRIKTPGNTLRLGQQVDGGEDFGHDFRGIRDQLPDECRKYELTQFGPAE